LGYYLSPFKLRWRDDLMMGFPTVQPEAEKYFQQGTKTVTGMGW
jgi:hypothetical protein